MPKKNTAVWWTLGVIAVLIIILVIARARGGTPSDDLTTAQADDWIKGDAKAGVTLIEYGDFQCPACASYQTVIKNLHQRFAKQ